MASYVGLLSVLAACQVYYLDDALTTHSYWQTRVMMMSHAYYLETFYAVLGPIGRNSN